MALYCIARYCIVWPLIDCFVRRLIRRGGPTGASVNGPSIGPFARWFIGCVIDRRIHPFIHPFFRLVLHATHGPFVDDSLIGWLVP